MEFLGLLWPQHVWFVGLLLVVFVSAMVASKSLVPARDLPGRLALLLCFVSVATVVEWFAFPILSEAIAPYLYYDLLDGGRLMLCFLAELIGVAVAARLVVPMRTGIALAMAGAMLMGNVFNPWSGGGGEITTFHLVTSFTFPWMGAVVAGLLATKAGEGTREFETNCCVALAVTFALVPAYGFLGAVVLLRHSPTPAPLLFPAVVAFVALAPVGVVYATRRIWTLAERISPLSLSVAAFVIPVPALMGMIVWLNFLGSSGLSHIDGLGFLGFFAVVFLGFLFATTWRRGTGLPSQRQPVPAG